MSNLNEELQRMATDGANRATPLAITEVMRRGSRRRARTIGQRSIGGLSVLSISAAVIVGGAFHPLHGVPSHPASGTARVTTLTETSKTSDGTLTVQVKYRKEPQDNVKVLGVTYTGTTTAISRSVHVVVAFAPPSQSQPAASCRFNVLFIQFPRVHENHNFSGSLNNYFGRPGTQKVTCSQEKLWVSVLRAFGKHSTFLQESLVLGGSFSSPLG